MLESLKKNLKKLKFNIGWKSLILIGVCGVLIFTDLITKYFAVKDEWSFIVIKNFIEVVKVEYNNGAAFNMLSGAQIFLIVVTFIMLAVLITAFIFLPERFLVLKVAISMIIAGAIGNLVDRLAFSQVRDFVSINMLFTTAICNFADFWIVIGTIVAIIDILFLDEFALIPLTKRAKAAQAEAKERENIEKAELQETAETSEAQTDVETENDKASNDDSENNG